MKRALVLLLLLTGCSSAGQRAVAPSSPPSASPSPAVVASPAPGFGGCPTFDTTALAAAVPRTWTAAKPTTDISTSCVATLSAGTTALTYAVSAVGDPTTAVQAAIAQPPVATEGFTVAPLSTILPAVASAGFVVSDGQQDVFYLFAAGQQRLITLRLIISASAVHGTPAEVAAAALRWAAARNA